MFDRLLLQSGEFLHCRELVAEHSQDIAGVVPGLHASPRAQPDSQRCVSEGCGTFAGDGFELRGILGGEAVSLEFFALVFSPLSHVHHCFPHELQEHLPGSFLPGGVGRNLRRGALLWFLLVYSHVHPQSAIEDLEDLAIELHFDLLCCPFTEQRLVDVELPTLFHHCDLQALRLLTIEIVLVQVLSLDWHETVAHKPVLLEGLVPSFFLRLRQLVQGGL